MPFDTLPDHARLWLFATDRDLSADEQAAVRDAMQAFATAWTSHRRPVPAEAGLLAGRILAVAAQLAEGEVNAGVSGCGIDSLQRAVDALAEAIGFGWTTGLDVVYREADGAIRAVPRPAFRALARDGRVAPDTPVFDLTLTTVGALRRDGVERPASASWHGRVFRLAGSTSASA